MHELWGSADLWEGARGGDAEAFSRLLQDLSGPLRGFLYRLGGFRGEIDDLCQEVLVRLVEGLPRLQDPARARSFVLGIALRVHQERRRQRVAEAEAPEPVTGAASPLACAVAEELQQRVREAMAALPESLREVLVLIVFEGLEPKEAAELLGLSPGALRHRLFRARNSLRELLNLSEVQEADS